jgi:hypothetical protein
MPQERREGGKDGKDGKVEDRIEKAGRIEEWTNIALDSDCCASCLPTFPSFPSFPS